MPNVLYHNKMILSLLYQIIIVILLAEKIRKKTNALSYSQIITERTNFLLPARQM